jgi:hypothetical protein
MGGGVCYLSGREIVGNWIRIVIPSSARNLVFEIASASPSNDGELEVKVGFVDIALIVVIIAGAVYLLYRSLWKKKGHCPGCDSGTCDKK